MVFELEKTAGECKTQSSNLKAPYTMKYSLPATSASRDLITSMAAST